MEWAPLPDLPTNKLSAGLRFQSLRRTACLCPCALQLATGCDSVVVFEPLQRCAHVCVRRLPCRMDYEVSWSCWRLNMKSYFNKGLMTWVLCSILHR